MADRATLAKSTNIPFASPTFPASVVAGEGLYWGDPVFKSEGSLIDYREVSVTDRFPYLIYRGCLIYYIKIFFFICDRKKSLSLTGDFII